MFASSDHLGASVSSLLLPETEAEITLGKEVLSRFDKLVIEQYHNKFHTFKLEVDHDVLEEPHAYNPEQSKDLIGEILNVTFKQKNGSGGENYFKGIVTSVDMAQSEGYHGKVVLEGHSPDYLLDGQPHLQCFYQESIRDIIDKLTGSLKNTQTKVEVKPANGAGVEYACQFKESNYNFLKRLAADLGEWFFYDGKTLNFGKPKDTDPVPLIYGKDSEKMSVKMKLKPLSFGRYAYDIASDGFNVQKAPDSLKGLGSFGDQALSASKKLFKDVGTAPVSIPQTSEKAAQSRMERHAADLFIMKGESLNPLLYPGVIVELKHSIKNEKQFDHKDSGKYRIISVTHSITAKGNYTNKFEAIPADAPMLPAEEIKRPKAEAQLATVTDNHDPDGLGRVRVKFIWQDGDVYTPFIRAMSPDFGADEKSGKNRGYFWIPEKGDQVLIQFLDGAPEQPYIVGAMAHGKNMTSSAQKQNNIKSISTRSGHSITMDDANGGTSVIIKDPAGNVIHLDSQGQNITITAPATMTLNGKRLILNADDIEMNGTATIKMNSSAITAANGDGNASTITLKGDITSVEAKLTKITATTNNIEGVTTIKGDTVTIN